jgi:predicted nucleic acid-binding protein
VPKPARERAYWDACVLMSVLCNYSDRRRDEVPGLKDTMLRVESGDLQIFITHLYQVEVLDSKQLDVVAKERVQRLFQRRRCQPLNTNHKASELAGEIRDFYKGKMDQMDAVHLATAIHYRIPTLHTYDNGGKGGVSLLKLSGTLIADKYVIDICKPTVRPGQLWLTDEA